MGSCVKAGDDLLSPWTDYHRPRVLNGRVRDGNGCGHSGLVTGSTGGRVVVVRLSRLVRRDRCTGGSLTIWRAQVAVLLVRTGAGERTERPSDRLLVPVS